jgi:hypothetical protein
VVIESLVRTRRPGRRRPWLSSFKTRCRVVPQLGFCPPLGADEATAYWRSVFAAVRARSRLLLVAREDH